MAKRPSLTGGNANIESKPKKTRQMEMVSILNMSEETQHLDLMVTL